VVSRHKAIVPGDKRSRDGAKAPARSKNSVRGGMIRRHEVNGAIAENAIAVVAKAARVVDAGYSRDRVAVIAGRAANASAR
jgi:hypothetical protein